MSEWNFTVHAFSLKSLLYIYLWLFKKMVISVFFFKLVNSNLNFTMF